MTMVDVDYSSLPAASQLKLLATWCSVCVHQVNRVNFRNEWLTMAAAP